MTSKPWPNRTFAVFDTETTGLDPQEDRIIQAGLAVFSQGMLVKTWNWLFNTEKPSAPEAIAVHGITDDERWENGQSTQDIVPLITTAFRQIISRKLQVIGFNIPFDLMMLRSEMARLDISDEWLHDLMCVDPLVIDRHYEKNVPAFTRPYMRLQMMCKRYGIMPPTHDAVADAVSTGYLAITQSLHHPSIRHVSPAELHRAQVRWHSEWAASFRSFAARKGFEVNISPWPHGISVKGVPQELQDVLFNVISAEPAMGLE